MYDAPALKGPQGEWLRLGQPPQPWESLRWNRPCWTIEFSPEDTPPSLGETWLLVLNDHGPTIPCFVTARLDAKTSVFIVLEQIEERAEHPKGQSTVGRGGDSGL